MRLTRLNINSCALHRELRRGATLGQALRDARSGTGGGPVQTATGWSFIALGS